MPTNRALVATISKYIRDKVEPGTLEQRVLTNMLMRHSKVEFNQGGVNVQWPVRYRRVGNFREHDVFDTVTVAPEKSEVLLSEGYGRYIQTEFIDDEEKLVNRGNPEKIYDLYRTKSEAMVEDGKDELHQELHAGTGTGRRIKGLNIILPASYGTVHGVSQSANAWHQHVLLDAAAGPNTNADTDRLERIRTAIMSSDRGDAAGRVSFGITTMTLYERLVEKHQANERYIAAGNTLGGELKFINVHEVPIFYDKHAETDVLRLINGKKLSLRFRTAGIFSNDVQRPSNKRGDQLVAETFPCLSSDNERYHAVIYNY